RYRKPPAATASSNSTTHPRLERRRVGWPRTGILTVIVKRPSGSDSGVVSPERGLLHLARWNAASSHAPHVIADLRERHAALGQGSRGRRAAASVLWVEAAGRGQPWTSGLEDPVNAIRHLPRYRAIHPDRDDVVQPEVLGCAGLEQGEDPRVQPAAR